jgi:hypothetical protein
MRNVSGLVRSLCFAAAAGFVALPAQAQMADAGVQVVEAYKQTGPNSFSPLSSIWSPGVLVHGPNDFASLTMTYPGAGSPVVVQGPATLGQFGYQMSPPSAVFASLNSLQAAYPFGTYTFTATRANGSTQAASVAYNANLFPGTVPQFSSLTLSALQGLNSESPFTFDFSTTGNAFNQLNIVTASNSLVYATGTIPIQQQSVSIPGNILQPGTTYYAEVSSSNVFGAVNGQGVFAFQQFIDDTVTKLTTVQATTDLTVSGGTAKNPLVLPPGPPIGRIAGSIGGFNSSDFYAFSWTGGAFFATLSVPDAHPGGSYAFELIDQGQTIDDVTLDDANHFSADISQFLQHGDYTIGLVATSLLDPHYAIDFATPVRGLPEPATWPMMLVGLGIIGAGLRVSRREGVKA